MCRRLVDNGYDFENIISRGLQIAIPFSGVFGCFERMC